jgi:TDG/mug DNA glycosylase family protein
VNRNRVDRQSYAAQAPIPRVPRYRRSVSSVGAGSRTAAGGCKERADALDLRALTEIVVPNEMARQLGVTGLQLRNWLRAQAAAGHPLLSTHQQFARWEFTRPEAEELMSEFKAARRTGTAPRVGNLLPEPHRARVATSPSPAAAVDHSSPPNAGHRTTEEWIGEEVETLGDLLRPGLRAVVVGINPSPVSVAKGHYYQGRSGQRFFERLGRAGVLPDGDGFEDDRAFAAGIGFTDVVKRPTPRETGLRPGEMDHGQRLLEAKLTSLAVPKILFTFKGAAKALLGPFDGHGLLAGRPLCGAEVFVMPGPMEQTDRVERALRQLQEWWVRPSSASIA